MNKIIERLKYEISLLNLSDEDLTGDSEVFYCTRSQAIELGIIKN